MFTATDYRDGKCNHHEYYAQFVNESVRRCVLSRFGIDGLLASDDEHLNDIPLVQWDRLPIKNLIDTKLFKACHNTTYGERDRHKFIWSPCDNVCIAKTAAKILIAEHTAAK